MPPRARSSMTREEKKRKRKESNKEAARRCRKRKVLQLQALAAESARLQTDNAGLKALITEYKDKLADLQSENHALLLARKFHEELVIHDDGDLMELDDDVPAEIDPPPQQPCMDDAGDPLFLTMDGAGDPLSTTLGMDDGADLLDAYCQQLMLEDDDMPWSCFSTPPAAATM